MIFPYVLGTEKAVFLPASAPASKVVRDKLYGLIPEEAVAFIGSHVSLESKTTKVISTTTIFNIENLDNEHIENLVNLHKINDIRYVNKFFEAVNHLIVTDGLFIGCAETLEERKRRIFKKYSKLFAYPFYFIDFMVKRVLPKTKFTKKFYFLFTRGLNRVISLPEVLGRLISCGFEIVEHREINNLLYFVARKTSNPYYNEHATYGPLIKLKRRGKDGKFINVYKLRTMHPYSEYLQDYIYKMNQLETGGKFKNDFRVTYWGKWLRKLWIDELPMLWNFVKGDLKIVGVRPLSTHYMSLYTQEIKERRIKYTPGLVPPFYADMPKTLEEIMASEVRYLDEYDKNPILTDIKYFFKAFFNIFFKHARSN